MRVLNRLTMNAPIAAEIAPEAPTSGSAESACRMLNTIVETTPPTR